MHLKKQKWKWKTKLPATNVYSSYKIKKNVQEKCQQNDDSNNFRNDTEICKLKASFQALNDSIIALTTTLEEAVNDKYSLENENFRLEKELNVFKNKHANLTALHCFETFVTSSIFQDEKTLLQCNVFKSFKKTWILKA